MLAESLEPDEDVDTAYNQLLHTIGNLTLSGYNTELSNSSFSKKRELLRDSGVWMNRAIADSSTWGRGQITERSKKLAELIIETWPGPNPSAQDSSTMILWTNLAKLLAEIPAGRWVTYGDVAAVIGTHAVPLGNRLANHPMTNAHRVLRADGRVADNFRWTDPSRTDSARDVLEQEGIVFDADGFARAAQRLTLDELAELAGLDIDADAETAPEIGNIEREADFWAQVAQNQSAEVANALATVLTAWRHLGGGLMFGNSQETSCFVLVQPTERRPWPLTIYPTGKMEVVFQHMSKRPPFDDIELRREFLDQLNGIDGINLESALLDRRPGFEMGILTTPGVVDQLIDVLAWFYNQAK